MYILTFAIIEQREVVLAWLFLLHLTAKKNICQVCKFGDPLIIYKEKVL
jgi:hypothetical protein